MIKKLKMYRTFPLFLFFALSVILIFPCLGSAKPLIKSGYLDLSDWDFQIDGNVKLNGHWEFYWNQLLKPEDFSRAEKPELSGYFPVPDTWNGYQFFGEDIAGEGYATYRLKVTLKDSNQTIALNIRTQGRAYRIWANDQLLASNGIVGKNRSTSTPGFLPHLLFFTPEQKTIYFTVQSSNYHNSRGGFKGSIEIGTFNHVLENRESALTFEVFLIGALIIMAIYHFGLFFLRREDKSPLYFGLFCLVISFRQMFLGERVLLSIYPDIHWLIIHLVGYLSFIIAVPLFSSFIRSLYPHEYSKSILKAQLLAGLAFSLALILLPPETTYLFIPPYEIISIITIFYILYVFYKVAKHKRGGIISISIGVTVLFVCVINDILYDHMIIETGYFVTFGLFVFTISQSFLLSTRSAKAFNTVEIQKKELNQINEQLEEKVADRTKALWVKNEQSRQLIHILCHDLMNPLAGIKSILGLLEKRPEILADAKSKMLFSVDNGLKMIKMVRSIRALEDNKLQLALNCFPLQNLIESSQNLLSQRFREKNIDLAIQIDPGIKVLVEETSFINTVINNLLTNALKFSYSGSAISIKATERNGEVELSISDEGIGIPAELLTNMFNLDKSTTRIGTNMEFGTGYGMPLVKKFVEAYHGSITIESVEENENSKNHGTTIKLKLKSC